MDDVRRGPAAAPAAAEFSLSKPSFLVHTFVTVAGADAAAGWAHLRRRWPAVAGAFDLTRPVPGLGVGVDLPDEPPDRAGGQTVAAAGRPGPGIWQAVVRLEDNVAALSVMAAPAVTGGADATSAAAATGGADAVWADLEAAWTAADGGWEDLPAGVLGEARLFLGLYGPAAERPDGRPAGDQVARAVRASVPAPTALGWWRRYDDVALAPDAGGLLIWEAGPTPSDAAYQRRLVALAPTGRGRAADRLVWTDGTSQWAPLTRHLLHAARVRHQIRVFGDGRATRVVRDRLDSEADALGTGPCRTGAAGTEAAEGGAAGTGAAGRGAAGTGDLTAARIRAGNADRQLGRMRAALTALEDNLRAAVDLPAPPADATGTGPLRGDRELTAWFAARINEETDRMRTALDQAGQVADLARTAPEPAGGSPTGTDPTAPRRAVILTALDVEYDAVREQLSGPWRELEERGTLYEIGVFAAGDNVWSVALAQAGTGGPTAAVQVDRAVRRLSPEVVLLVGIAGGRRAVSLGDVVVADAIYDYESAKAREHDALPRIKTHSPSFRLLQRARMVARQDRWQQRIRPTCPDPPPTAVISPLAAGGKLIAHGGSAAARLLDRYCGDAVAVEMEGHGFLQGAYVNSGVDALVIRGVATLIARAERPPEAAWRVGAARHAAAFALELLGRHHRTVT